MANYTHYLYLFVALLASVRASEAFCDDLRPEVRLNAISLELDCLSPSTHPDAGSESASWLINGSAYSETDSLIRYNKGDRIQCALWTGGSRTGWSPSVVLRSKCTISAYAVAQGVLVMCRSITYFLF